ncbi:MAG TPA: EpsD family peptidyl-prolyl cis-trans isomerase [Usitatibacter sp.]
MNRSAMLRAAAVAAAMAATACARDEGSAPRDVAARVNGGDVPLARVDAAIADDATKGTASRALEAAIDEELLVQKALAARIDRDPEVLRKLEDSRRRILARAWLDRAVAQRARPDPAQVHAFYVANPALFEARRIYSLRRLAVEGAARRAAALREVALRGDAHAVEAWLAREGLRFDVRETTEPAEAVPLALLARLRTMKDGEAAVIQDEGRLEVVELVRSIPAPLAEAEAAPTIEAFLASRRRLELAREEIDRLRGEARIEYLAGPGARGRTRKPPRDGAFAVHAALEPTFDSPADLHLAASVAAPAKEPRS